MTVYDITHKTNLSRTRHERRLSELDLLELNIYFIETSNVSFSLDNEKFIFHYRFVFRFIFIRSFGLVIVTSVSTLRIRGHTLKLHVV